MAGSKLFPGILAAVLGILVFSQIVTVFSAIVLIAYFGIFKPHLTGIFMQLLIWTIILFTVILGVTLGLNSYNKKNQWYSVFKPSKRNVVIAGILALALFTIPIIWMLFEKIFEPGTIVIGVNYFNVARFLTIIPYFILFFPFSALCDSAFSKKINGSKFQIILLLVILNPFFLLLANGLNSAYNQKIMAEPCGAEVISFIEPSPAESAGVKLGDVIIQINDVKVKTVNDLKSAAGLGLQPTVLYTRSGSYNVMPVLIGDKYLLGINVSQATCVPVFQLS